MSKFKANRRPLLLLTPGEPAGIGPDIVIQQAAEKLLQGVIVIADPDLMLQRARQLNLLHKINMQIISHIADSADSADNPNQNTNMLVYPVKLAARVKAGELNIKNARYVLTCLEIATAASSDALITGPVQKSVINAAGFDFTGHTRYLAELAKIPPEEVVMFFASDHLRLSLVTDHLALKDIVKNITARRVANVIKKTAQALQHYFHIEKPRLDICGLNPHAGENGYLGKEEEEIILPVMKKLQAENPDCDLRGPLAADTAFAPLSPAQDKPDAIVAMYHDQGLTAFKQQAFGRSMNMTLGLPFLRTSVDHGTALALAGTGQADSSSLAYVMQLTRQILS